MAQTHRGMGMLWDHEATKSLGETAYELDLIGRPLYHDGTRRPVWGKLGGVARWSWERNPTPRWPAPVGAA